MHIEDLEIALDHNALAEVRGGFFLAFPIYVSSLSVATTFPTATSEPAPSGPVPVPYPNTGMATDKGKGSKKVKIKH